jgi:ubiquinone biosynthesis protein UbiJ
MTDTDRLRADAQAHMRYGANPMDVEPDALLALLDEVDTLRDEAERLRIRIENDQIRMAQMAECASGEL